MPEQLHLSHDQKVEILRALLEESQADRMFWRERAWNTLSAAITALIALGSVSAFREATLPFLILIVGVWGSSTLYLFVAFFRYRDVRSVRLKLQEALGFFENGFYLQGQTLISEKERRIEPRWGGFAIFILLLFVVAACAVAAVFVGNTEAGRFS